VTAPLLRLEGVSKRCSAETGWLTALEDVALSFAGRGVAELFPFDTGRPGVVVAAADRWGAVAEPGCQWL
jgi:hypothetical protein